MTVVNAVRSVLSSLNWHAEHPPPGGTAREYWVYVPAQYKPDKPACVFVCQDGIRYEAPTVFDNLINKKEMPVTIGVFVAPGVVKATDSSAALDRFK